MVTVQLYMFMEKIKFQPYLTLYAEINIGGTADLNVEVKW